MIETPEKAGWRNEELSSVCSTTRKESLVIEDNKPDCIEKLRELTKDEPRMEVLALKTKYPQGVSVSLFTLQQGAQLIPQCFRQTQDVL